MKYILRFAIWTIVGIIVFLTFFTILRQKIIIHNILNNPLLAEFKRCKNLGYEYEFYNPEEFNFGWWLNPRLKRITFSLVDTIYASKVKYYYKVHVILQNNTVKDVDFAHAYKEITPEQTVEDLITKIEGNRLLNELIKIVHVDECHAEPQILRYTNAKGEIHCDYNGDIVYLKIRRDIPVHLTALPYYETFLAMINNEGFTTMDFDSIIYINRYNAWHVQGFITECGKDVIDVSGYVGQKGDLKWLSNPDTINPLFLRPKVYEKLLATGLSPKYVDERFKLLETSATRSADYYKKGDKVIELSRISGYFTYAWKTDTWIDKLCGGLKIKISFTCYLDRKDLESVRMGTPSGPHHEQINLHPVSGIITFEKLKSIIPAMDTTKMNYEIDEDGHVRLTNRKEEIIDDYAYIYEYKIDLESGAIEKAPYVTSEHGIITGRKVRK